MSISPLEKFLILTEDVAKLTKIFMGKKANFVKFIWFVKYFFNVFAADLNLGKNVFQIDMPPSFLLWWIDQFISRKSFCRTTKFSLTNFSIIQNVFSVKDTW